MKTNTEKKIANSHIGHTLIPQIQFINDEQDRACKEQWTSLEIQETTPLIKPLDTSKHPSIECTCKNATDNKTNILFHHMLIHNNHNNSTKITLLLSCPIKSCDKTTPSQAAFQRHLKIEHDLELGKLPLTAFCTKCNELCPHYNAKGNQQELDNRRTWLNEHFNGPFQLMLDDTYFTRSNNNPSEFKDEYLSPTIHSLMKSNTLEKERSIQTETTCSDSCIKSTYWMIHFAFYHNQLKEREKTLCPLKDCLCFYGNEQSSHLRRHGESFLPTKMPFFLHCITCNQTCPFIKNYKSKLGRDWSEQHINHALVVLIDPQAENQHHYKKNWSMPPLDAERLASTVALINTLPLPTTEALDVDTATVPTSLSLTKPSKQQKGKKRKDATPHDVTQRLPATDTTGNDCLCALPLFPENTTDFGFGLENAADQSFNFEDI